MLFKKNTFYLFILIGLLGITSLCHAESSTDKTSIEEVKQETQALLRTLKAYTVDQRDEAIRKTKTALDSLDKRIDALQVRIDESWDQMDSATREKTRASLKELRKERTQVAEWYGSMKSSTGATWGHMKKGFSDAYKSLTDAWETSLNEFVPDK